MRHGVERFAFSNLVEQLIEIPKGNTDYGSNHFKPLSHPEVGQSWRKGGGLEVAGGGIGGRWTGGSGRLHLRSISSQWNLSVRAFGRRIVGMANGNITRLTNSSYYIPTRTIIQGG